MRCAVKSSGSLVIPLSTNFQGGGATFTEEKLFSEVNNSLTFNVYQDMLAFTGLNDMELLTRLRRELQHHFYIEHQYYSPESSRELALYYRHSVGYLWGNAVHNALDFDAVPISPENAPVLDYAGGSGSNYIALAMRGIECIYFGIEWAELEFAEFRARRHGLKHFITFVKPYTEEKFDPIYVLEVGKTLITKLGAIIAQDAFEHIPNYERTGRHLVSLLRDGGMLFEKSPFDSKAESETSIHIKKSVRMEVALEGMVYKGKVGNSNLNMWVKE